MRAGVVRVGRGDVGVGRGVLDAVRVGCAVGPETVLGAVLGAVDGAVDGADDGGDEDRSGAVALCVVGAVNSLKAE